ncbi:LysR substrate binding domain-containing protein [Agrobacterium vitis]|nr:LysR substrate binding domain-containing protein [Agrobacterium vitis]
MHMLFCRVVARIARVAPKITFDLLPFDEKPEELIRRGEVDFLIFPNVFLSSSFHKEPLFEERLVGVAWRDIPKSQTRRHLANICPWAMSPRNLAARTSHR